jgi:hypothetical protein
VYGVSLGEAIRRIDLVEMCETARTHSQLSLLVEPGGFLFYQPSAPTLNQ